jgi:1,4-dihydroxy-2-naphthoate octaprenyltransferase
MWAFFLSLTYCLGAGISHYLGHPFQPAAFGLGWLAAASLQVGFLWSLHYFRLPLTPLAPQETARQRERFRTLLLQSTYAALTIAGVSLVTLMLTDSISPAAAMLLFLSLIFLLAYSVPPLRLAEKGYGELILAVNWGTLAPAASFLLQTDDYHRLLPMIAFPVTLLALAYLLAADFPTFASDNKIGRRTLLSRLSWQRALPTHHVLVLSAFLLLAVSPFMGVPWGLVSPAFFALPFAVLQVYWLQRIGSGGRPFWRFVNVLLPAVFGLTAYLLASAVWLR